MRLSIWRQGREQLAYAPVSPNRPSATTKHTDAASDIRVFFRSFRSDNWDIYYADGDFIGQQFVHTDASADVHPRARLGGGNVLFSSNRTGQSQLYRQDFDGSDLIQLTSNRTSDLSRGAHIHGDWSPDGKKIAYANNDTGSWNVYTMDLNGSNVRCVSCGEPASNVAPAWSPDGKRIAWLMVNTSSGQSSLKVMDADGANKATLINNVYYADTPRWAPDGVHIALDYAPAEGQWNRVAVVNAMNGSVREVYNPNQALVDGSMGSWSPDGQSIYFTRWEYVNQNGQLLIQASYIGRVSWLGGAPQILTTSGRDATPDAKTIDKVPPSSSLSLPAWSQAQLQTVRIAGSDTGSGIDHYDIQAKVGSAGAWTDWKPGLTSNETFLSGEPGQTFSLRVRANDYAGNVEEWPQGDGGDGATTFFAHKLEAQSVDNRGNPIPGPQVTSTRALGTYHFLAERPATEIYSTDAQTHALTLSHIGYANPGAHTVLPEPVYQRIFHVHAPMSTTIADGGFETGTLHPAWVAQPATSARVSERSRHTGQFGLTLGPRANYTQESFAVDPIYRRASTLFIDRVHGNGYFAVRNDGRLILIRRTTAQPGQLTPIDTGIGDLFFVDVLAIAQAPNGFHGIWSRFSRVEYCFLPAATAQCAAPEVLGTISSPAVAGASVSAKTYVWAEDDGSLTAGWLEFHDAYGGAITTQAFIRTRNGNGVWGATRDIRGLSQIFHLASGANGDIHVFWRERGITKHIVVRSDGSRTAATEFPSDSLYNEPKVARDSADAMHFFFVGPSVIHLVRTSDGRWSQTNFSRVGWVANDKWGRVHLVQRTQQEWVYAIQTSDGQTIEVARYPLGQYAHGFDSIVAGINRVGDFAIWLNYEQSTLPVAVFDVAQPPTTSSRLTRQMLVGAELRNPTLSFVFRTLNDASTSMLRVSVDNGGTPSTKLASQSGDGAWRLFSMDMSPWAGQTVTVTLEATLSLQTQPFDIDEFSLGEWTTPVINQASPQRLAANAPATTLTLIGANFAATPTLSINGVVTLTNVVFGNAGLITATLPAGLPVGRHDIWLTNPDGQQTVKAGALQVGERIAMPLAFR